MPDLPFLHLAEVTFFFNDWEAIGRVLFITVAGYLTLLTLLRVSGQRTLAQLSSFDLVITVTVGSAFGRVITAREVALLEVFAAFGALVGLQFLVALFWGRAPKLRRLVTPTPALLYYDGEVIEREMRRTHLREADLLAAARKQGLGSLQDVRAVLLEANGALAVLTADQFGDGAVMDDLA